MNVFEFAKKMELDGIHFYQDEAAKTSQPGFKAILELLIEEEKKHYHFFELLERQLVNPAMLSFPFSKAKNIFEELRHNNEGFNFSAEQTRSYEKALEIEKESEKFYREQAVNMTDETLKQQILFIAEEEKKHVMLFSDLVEYISRPAQWVEHADFSQPRKEY